MEIACFYISHIHTVYMIYPSTCKLYVTNLIALQFRICKTSRTQSLYSVFFLFFLFWLKVFSSELVYITPPKWSYHLGLCWSPLLVSSVRNRTISFSWKSTILFIGLRGNVWLLATQLFVTQHYVLHHSNQVLFSQLLLWVICSSLGLPSATLCHQLQSLVVLYSLLVKSEGSEEIHFSNVTKIPQQYVDFVFIFFVSTSLVCRSYRKVVK